MSSAAPLLIYGLRGLLHRKIGWSIGPLLTTTLSGVPGLLFSLACATGGGLMAVPLVVTLVSNQPNDTPFIQIATYIGVPLVVIGFIFAIVVQLALDLGRFIAWLREKPSQ